jgi:toxin CptA
VSAIGRVIRVEPSAFHQQILLAGHLLVVCMLWPELEGGLLVIWLVCLLSSLVWSLIRARRRHFALNWQDDALLWSGFRHRIGDRSRIGPGFLWLELVCQETPGARDCILWLFADSLAPEDYRELALRIQLLREKNG